MSANIKASTDGTQAIIGVGGVDQMTVSNAGVVTANSFVGAISAGNISSSTAIATGSTTARTLANRFADVVNVKDFGAIGDGVADDTAALQAAIDFAITNKGVLNFEYGKTYKISLWLKFFKETSPDSGIYLPIGPFGVNGNNATIIAASTMPYTYKGCLISVISASNFFIKDLILDGNGINRTRNPALDVPVQNLQVYASNNFRIENVTSNNSPIDGIYVSELGTTKSTNFSIRNCSCEYNGRQGISLIGVSDFVVDGCNLSNTGKGGFFQTLGPCAGIDLEGNTLSFRPERGTVSNCIINNNKGSGIMQFNGLDIVLSNNIISGHTDISIGTDYVGSGVYFGGASKNTIVSNNVIKNNNFGINIGTGSLTYFNQNVTISNNQIFDSIKNSLFLNPTTNLVRGLVVTNNIFDGCSSVTRGSYAVVTGVWTDIFSGNLIKNMISASSTPTLPSGCFFWNSKNGVCSNNTIIDGETGNCYAADIDGSSMLIGNYFNTTALSDGGTTGQGSCSVYNYGNSSYVGVMFGNRDPKRTSTSNLDGRRIYSSAAIPTLGQWEKGDMVYFNQPNASGSLGAICTTTGTPGTWKTFGAISA